MALSEQEVTQLFQEAGGLLRGHFRLSSGLHSDTFLQAARLLQDPRVAHGLCAALADLWRDASPEVVIGPATGGIILAYEVARQLGVRALFSERRNDRMALGRGFFLTPRERVLVVDDVITTGASVRATGLLAEAMGATVVGVGCLADRGGGGSLPWSTRGLLRVSPKEYRSEECPQCRQGTPLVEPDQLSAQAPKRSHG
jgi:orotate phosphoribosyltransferase